MATQRTHIALAITFALGAAMTPPTALADLGTHRLNGTWECTGPGQTHPMKPPIVWFEDAAAGDAEVGVDAFAGEVYGVGAVSAAEDGRLRITFDKGGALTVRALSATRRSGRMELTRDGGATYHCLRLPHTTSP